MGSIRTVAHLTSVHPRSDTRIFVKMCLSLAREGFCVSLVVADGEGDVVNNGVSIFDVGAKNVNRFYRIWKIVGRVFEKAKVVDADIYHLHDPELIPVGLKLKKLGKIVIFDAHEDFPNQLLSKAYLSRPIRCILANVFKRYERISCKRFDAVVAATPFIRDKFLKINKNTIDINNFPVLDEFINYIDWEEKDDEVVYVGSIAEIRGIKEIVLALDFTEGLRLNLAGIFSDERFKERVKCYSAWSRVNELGFLSRSQVTEIMAKSKVGLVILHPTINYIDALPVKMFEYMAAGIPCIASDFPIWREILESNQCGICVDPLDPEAIGQAIQYLIDQPAKSEQMGKNGRQAVEQKYNWSVEEQKLFKLYESFVV